MKNLLITRRMPERVLVEAQKHFDVTLRERTAPMTSAEAKVALKTYDFILPTLGDAFGADVFEVGPFRCALLANFGVGYNHIDVKAAGLAGVAVSNTPGAVTDATADTAMTLILMSARRAGEGERLLRAGAWDGWQPTQMLGMHVTGKKIGIIGMGRIGKAIAKRCHFGFDMEVLFYNRSKVEDAGCPAEQIESLEELAGQVDILVVAVPGGPATHHLVGKGIFDAMQSHAHFINIARGDVVDEQALIAALKAGAIGGAGLDVYEFEPAVPDDLRRMENVTLLPHLGTAALEVREAMGLMAVANLVAFAAGDSAPNAVS
ncbi:2-hydroxyacid dehydrogenase [Cochlodiniinecator piscidefendens]|uniref:2-hydroxyacid dehydrogenase n=1 Tax=Cochlodiniinecator piscidefendens TaxID=2715756 RepID=UPI001E5A9383|nr:D-glycerate dehydrogenase [Cochlodiniinecator piscidefendens]